MSEELHLREIRSDDIRSKLSLGAAEFTPLKIFLNKSAVDFHQLNIAKTYVLADKNTLNKAKVWGYVSLMSSEIMLDTDHRPCENSNAPRYEVFPAVKIARLAVDKNLQGKGYGMVLLGYCSTLVKQLIMPHIGCRFLVVDSKVTAVPFYKKAGFTLLETAIEQRNLSSMLFLDLHKHLRV